MPPWDFRILLPENQIPTIPVRIPPQTSQGLIMGFFQNIATGLELIAFPNVCVSCGRVMNDRDRMLCGSCTNSKFEDPNPSNKTCCGNWILPEGFLFQDALWRYDKEGIIQEMVRMLKYQGVAKLGRELGQAAGLKLIERHIGNRLPENKGEIILLPVPLHKARQKKRGYNQARLIAEGISEISGIAVADEHVMQRVRNTISQTRFSFSKRMDNLKDAFRLTQPETLSGKFVIIVDDVYTTGSTCFSLGGEIRKAGVKGIGVMTIGIA